jgi:thymidylate synthase
VPGGDKTLLTVSAYFRSWDLWAGFPTNLGGIQLMKKLVAEEAGLTDGPMYAYSAGAHIYGYQEDIARIRTMREKAGK